MRLLAAAIVVLLVTGSRAQDTMRTRNAMRVSRATANGIIANWKAEPKKAAEKMIAKYGEPNEASATTLTWWNNGPWKFTIIENIEIPHSFPMPHKDLMRQGI